MPLLFFLNVILGKKQKRSRVLEKQKTTNYTPLWPTTTIKQLLNTFAGKDFCIFSGAMTFQKSLQTG